MWQISQKNQEKIYDLNEKQALGEESSILRSLLFLPYTTPSYDTNNSIINFAFVTILNYAIIFMTITLILAIKNSHCIIDCR